MGMVKRISSRNLGRRDALVMAVWRRVAEVHPPRNR
jgi:hypothetical protein